MIPTLSLQIFVLGLINSMMIDIKFRPGTSNKKTFLVAALYPSKNYLLLFDSHAVVFLRERKDSSFLIMFLGSASWTGFIYNILKRLSPCNTGSSQPRNVRSRFAVHFGHLQRTSRLKFRHSCIIDK